MKQFILDRDIVKRLLYNKPINSEYYEQDFSNWIINPEQPSDGVSVTNNKIIITKIKPNVWFIKSNYDDMDQTNFLNKFYNKDFVLSGLNEARADNKISPYDDNPIGDSSVTYQAYGLVISPINSNGVLMSHVYPWDMNIPSGYFKHPVGYYSSWNVYGYSANERIKLYNWSCYWASYNQIAFAFYTSAETDENGYINFTTPIEISVPNLATVDPTTQEVFKLYKKDELIYERDKNIENLYKTYNLLKEDRNAFFKSLWQQNLENENPWGYDVQFNFDRSDYDYEKITLPVADDLIQAINDEMPLKFSITQFDIGRNKFWETIVRTINQKIITDVSFCYHLFKNARGFSELDWETIGDSVLHGIVINLGSSAFYSMNQCFYNSDVPAVTINCDGLLQDLGDTFTHSDVKRVKLGNGIIIRILSGAFENTTKLESVEGLVVGNNINPIRLNGKNRFLSYRTIALQYAFESTNLETLSLTGDDMIVYPFCPQMFGYFNYPTKLKTITGVALDFRLVDPNDMQNWGVASGYGHPIFGKCVIESIQIKNLNKGDWTIPMPLDDNSVIYLLNNIYNLAGNDGENLERDDNSFNDWNFNNAIHGLYDTVVLNKEHYCEISKSNWNGRKILKLKANNSIQITLTLKNQGSIVSSQQYNIGQSETIIDKTLDTFDEVLIGADLENYQNDVNLILTNPFDSAASNVTSATLSFTNVQYKSAFDTAIANAQAKGWTINFAS